MGCCATKAQPTAAAKPTRKQGSAPPIAAPSADKPNEATGPVDGDHAAVNGATPHNAANAHTADDGCGEAAARAGAGSEVSTPHSHCVRRAGVDAVSRTRVKQDDDAERLLRHGNMRNRPMTSSEFLGFLRMAPVDGDKLFLHPKDGGGDSASAAADASPGVAAVTPPARRGVDMELAYTQSTLHEGSVRRSTPRSACGGGRAGSFVTPSQVGVGSPEVPRSKSYMLVFSGRSVEDEPLERAVTQPLADTAQPATPVTPGNVGIPRTRSASRLSIFQPKGSGLAKRSPSLVGALHTPTPQGHESGTEDATAVTSTAPVESPTVMTHEKDVGRT